MKNGRGPIFGTVKLFRVLARLTLIAATVKTQGQALPSSTPPPIGQLIDVGGYRVHVNCIGQGNPAVMIAGAAFSFDWSLVQTEVAKFARVCTFDPSGTIWSDPYPLAGKAPSCDSRVEELHNLITRTLIGSPYILVGFSTGALWARLYAAEYPNNIQGMIIVDHAFLGSTDEPHPQASLPQSGHTPPVLISKAPIVTGFEDDPNFSRLSQRDQELHRWAMSQHPLRPGVPMVVDCTKRIDRLTGQQTHPLGVMPLIVISTPNVSSGYEELQKKLLSLSRDSKQLVAQDSFHAVPIDRPDIIIHAIRDVVEQARQSDTRPRTP